MRRTNRFAVLAAVGASVLSLTLAGCGSSGDASTTAPSGTASIPTADVISAVTTDPAINATLPPDVRASKTLLLGTVLNPGVVNLPHTGVVDGKDVGLDVELRDAVAKVLGVTWRKETGTFASIIPGVQNGKYQVGQANFGVTGEREKVVDFSTYVTDGQGFLAGAKVPLTKVNTIVDACGYTIATTPGSTFQKLLTTHADDCAKAGKKPWTVQYFNDTAPIFLGLANGKVDLFFGPVLSLKYDEKHIPGTKFVGQITSTPVGFVTAKDSGLAEPLSAAINKLIETGVYGKLFEKWDVPDTKIDKSLVNPPSTF